MVNCELIFRDVGLSRRRGAEARTDRTAQGQSVQQLPADRHLAVERFSYCTVEVFISPGQAEVEGWYDCGFQVQIQCIIVSFEYAGRIRPVAGKPVGADAEALISQVFIDEPGLCLPNFLFEFLHVILKSEGHVQRGVEEADIQGLGNIQVERPLKLRVSAGSVLRGDSGAHSSQLRVDGVVYEEVHAVVAEGSASIVRPAVEQRRGACHFPAQAKGDAPILEVAAKTRRKTAGKTLVKEEAVLGQIYAGVVGRRIGGHGGTAKVGAGQVGHPDCRRTVFKRIASEDTAARVGVAKKEAALHLALGIIAKGVQPGIERLQVKTEVAEEFIVVLDFGRAPYLRCGSAYMRVAGLDQPPRIPALYTTAGFVGVQKLEAEVGKAIVGQRQAQVGGHLHLVPVTVVGLAPTGVERQALGCLLQLEVQDTGDGIRAVLGCGAVTQDFDPLQRDDWDDGQVGTLRPAIAAVRSEGNDGGAVAAFAVDEHQGGVGWHSAQVGRPYKGGVAADGVLVDVIGGHGGGQQRVHVPDAVGLQILTLNDVHRHWRVLG